MAAIIPLKGRFHDKLIRQLTLKYIDEHGNTTENIKYICETMKISKNTIRNWMLEREQGKLEDGRLTRHVEPWTVEPAHFEFLLEYLETQDTRIFRDGSFYYILKFYSNFFSEMCDEIFHRFQIAYSEKQISRRLVEQHGWTQKKVEVHAFEQDPILRNRYLEVIRPPRLGGAFSSEQIIFIIVFLPLER